MAHWRALKGTPAGTPAALRRRFSQTRPPFDPYAIAAGIGVEVLGVADRSWSGAVRFSGDRATIWLNDGATPRQKRYALAYQLGHLMLRKGDEGCFRDWMDGCVNDERDANAFAGELLLPEAALRQYAALVGFDMDRLATLFDVTREALQVRLAMLAANSAA